MSGANKKKSAWRGKAAKGLWEQEVRKLSLGALLVLRLPFAFLYFLCLRCTSRQKHHYCSWIPFRWLLGFDAALRKSGCLRAATEAAKWICDELAKRWWLATRLVLSLSLARMGLFVRIAWKARDVFVLFVTAVRVVHPFYWELSMCQHVPLLVVWS